MNENEEIELSKQEKNFTFTVKADFLNPEFTRANTYMQADGVEMTDLWVIDAVATVPGDLSSGLTIRQTIHQTPTDQDWGAPSMPLTLGTHHVLFLASRGQGAQYNNGIVTWTKPLDTFFLDYEVTVVKTSNGNRAVTLNRIATRLQLSVEDAIPSGTSTISLSPGKWYNGFNMLTAQPIQAENYSLPFSISSSQWNRTGLLLSMWGLSPSVEWTTNITINATVPDASASGSTALITDAPFLPNRTSKYTGNLFSTASASSVSLSTAWLQAYEDVY